MSTSHYCLSLLSFSIWITNYGYEWQELNCLSKTIHIEWSILLISQAMAICQVLWFPFQDDPFSIQFFIYWNLYGFFFNCCFHFLCTCVWAFSPILANNHYPLSRKLSFNLLIKDCLMIVLICLASCMFFFVFNTRVSAWIYNMRFFFFFSFFLNIR